jgi:hypothetical protein
MGVRIDVSDKRIAKKTKIADFLKLVISLPFYEISHSTAFRTRNMLKLRLQVVNYVECPRALSTLPAPCFEHSSFYYYWPQCVEGRHIGV